MTELKLKRVVLYKTGLGFFEKRGKIDLKDNKSIKITFKNTTMNDLLKTFSIMRISGDLMVSGVSYEGQDTNTAKLLEDSIIKLPDTDTLNTLIKQLRGFEVNFKLNNSTINGIIVGKQIKSEPVSDKSLGVISEPYVMIKKQSGSISTIKLKDITDIEIFDPIAKKDFNFFMDVVQGNKSEKFRNVNIYFQGEKQSEFLLTFLQTLPAYKVSWRMYLLENEDENAEKNEENTKNSKTQIDKKTESELEESETEISVMVHGWAIIDNVLDEDWENIKLTLISGLPVSFNYDSYSPLWISRPTVERTSNLNIDVPTSGDSFGQTRSIPTTSAKPIGGKSDKTPLEIVNNIVDSSNLKGGGYSYDVPMPVNVKRNQSSLIPILQSKSKAKLVSVYNEGVDKIRPMSTIEFINDTERKLEEGPIAVFKDDVFQGEAILPFLEIDERQRIPYAVNQAITVHGEHKTKVQKYHELSLQSYIYAYYFEEKQKIYKIKNISSVVQVLIIEHPKTYSYKLFDSPEPDEDTSKFYRFRLILKPEESRELILNERKKTSTTFYFDNLNRGIIEDWKEKNLLSENEYSQLIKLIEWSEKIIENNTKINELNNKKNIINEEQSRIRENLKVLTKSDSEKKLRERYIGKFETGESEIERIDKEIDNLKDSNDKIAKDRQVYIKNTFKI